MDFSSEGLVNLAGGAGEVDGDPVRIDLINDEALRLEPHGDGVDVALSQAEFFTKGRGREPLMVDG